MIDMKVEFEVNKVIVYLYENSLNIDNITLLNKDIKNLFIKLIKRYNLDFFGYSKVTIYNNYKYGNVLEIEKIYYDEFNSHTIDLKVVVYRNVLMYLEFDDYCFTKKIDKIICKDNKYLLNIDDIDNIMEYIEYGRINYNNS